MGQQPLGERLRVGNAAVELDRPKIHGSATALATYAGEIDNRALDIGNHDCNVLATRAAVSRTLVGDFYV